MIEGIDKKIVIIGAGPSGLFCAYLIKKQNPDILVEVIEKDSEVSKNSCCTGIISIDGYHKTSLKDYININDVVLNKIKSAKIYSPYDVNLDIKSENYQAYVIDRKEFDKKIRDLALKVNVVIKYNLQVTRVLENSLICNNLENKEKEEIKFDLLVGADGPNSIVRKSILDLESNYDFLQGYQILANGNFDENYVKLYFGDFSKGLFSWIVPESKTIARIGLATYLGKNPKDKFYEFVKEKNIEYDKIIENCSAILPISKPLDNFVRNNRLIIGDAACFLKATTGGGINFGLISSEIAAKSITDRVKYFKPLKNYNKELKKLKKELKLHYKIHKYFISKDNSDLEDLFLKLKKLDIDKFLSENGNIDYPTKFVTKIIKNPKYFSLYKEYLKFLKT